jgi:hypothetical protein
VRTTQFECVKIVREALRELRTDSAYRPANQVNQTGRSANTYRTSTLVVAGIGAETGRAT